MNQELKPFKCPICEGSGKLQTNMASGTSLLFADCHGCGGKGIIWDTRPSPLEELRELAKAISLVQMCQHCEDVGWFTERDNHGDPMQVQCEYCYTISTSLFNLKQKAEKILTEKGTV